MGTSDVCSRQNVPPLLTFASTSRIGGNLARFIRSPPWERDPQDDGTETEAWKRVAAPRRGRTPFDLSTAYGTPDVARIGNRIANISVLSLWAVPGFFDPIKETLGPGFLPVVTIFVLVQWGLDR